MTTRKLGAIGVTCPKHDIPVRDVTPGVSVHSLIECDLCGCVIMTTGCRECSWGDHAIRRNCCECGRDFCAECGSQAGIGRYQSAAMCNECLEKSGL